MKTSYIRIVLIMIFILSVSSLLNTINAQVPQKMSYQAVVRDENGGLIKSNMVGVRVQIIQGSELGGSVFVEFHQALTNANGLVTLKIGDGTVVYGEFSEIDWSDGPYFIKTETDPTGGTNYTIAGTSELMSVPYALFAGSSMPEGSIIMYSGEWNFDNTGLGTGTLSGWALCNGKNGTPDLTDRFVMGTNTSSQLKTTGGSNSYSLAIGQLPLHNHYFSTMNAGEHSHTLTINSAGNHGHNITIDAGGTHSHTNYQNGWGIWLATNPNYGLTVFEGNPETRYFPANSTSPGNTTTSTAGSHSHGNSCSSSGNHTHPGTAAIAGTHSHTGNTDDTGSGNPVDNRPAFVKLAYIIKL
ncbi:MAG: hypothetical protein RBS55_00375 [Bacteroidales bacterium]|nr:hypothetical protein [Bacteroidales bacterium]